MPDPVTTDAGAPAVVKPAFAPGTVIADRYRLEARLGAGGGGTVWRCFDTQLQATVAFKIVADDVDIERWRREVAMARRIADNNVCRVHDLGETEGCRYVTMELVEGASLRSKCHVDLPAEEARALFRQVVAGAAAIHAAGIVHRDLKPENVVVERSGRAVIVDFGLAKEPRSSADTVNLKAPMQTVTNTGMVVGTPRYMAPEQAVGDTVDARADVWALGLIGHELLSGALPAMEEGGGRHVGDLPKWPRAAQVVRRCVALLPKDRYEDARALLAALAEPRRGGARIAIAVVAAVVAALAVVGVRALVRRDETPRSAPIAKPARVQITKLTTTTDWPQDAPLSVAISADAARFAYTTPAGELLVGDLAGGKPKAWPMPVDADSKYGWKDLVTAWIAGWYRDGAIAVLGQTRKGTWKLFRVRETGAPVLVHEDTKRFAAALTPDDLPIVPKGGDLVDARNEQRLTVGSAAQIAAIAFSPDGKRVAIASMTKSRDELVIEVHALADEKPHEIWRGPSANPLGELLVWLDDDRLAFGATPPFERSQLYTHDLRTAKTQRRTELTDAFIATGSAARGSLLVVRGEAPASIQVGNDYIYGGLDKKGDGTVLAGWLDDNTLVYSTGTRIVRATLAEGKVEPWPGTTSVEVPDTIVDGAVIAHQANGDHVVVERIDADGKHTQLQRLPGMAVSTFVRCAADHAPPCVLERVEGEQVTWTLIDPLTGELGKQVGSSERVAAYTRSAAVTGDGKTLITVDGTATFGVHPLDGTERKAVSSTSSDTMQSIGTGVNGAVYVTALASEGWLFAAGKTGWKHLPYSDINHATVDARKQMRWFFRPIPSPDGTHVAVVVRELHVDVARVDGL